MTGGKDKQQTERKSNKRIQGLVVNVNEMQRLREG